MWDESGVNAQLTAVARRRLAPAVEHRLATEPVLVLHGPRTVGKSTLLAQVAERHSQRVIDCDEPATRAAVRADPGRFVTGPGPILIDEYQHVPELLDAIKAELNRDLQPGRFVLAGSTHYATLPRAGQALTGRVDIVEVLPLTQLEIAGVDSEPLLHRLLAGRGVPHDHGPSPTTRADYAQRATAGGLPVPLRRPPGAARARWYSTYVDLVIDRDVVELSRVRQREQLPLLLRQLAARSGQVLNIAAVAQAIGLERSSAENYVRLLEAVFLVERLPAWGTTLGSSVQRQPKIHVVDPGVMAWLLNLTPAKIAQNDPSVLSEYGHLVETFAVRELLVQASWWDAPVRAGHFRTTTGGEVDLVLERDDGQVFAFEVKAGSRIHPEDLRGVRALRNRLGARLEQAILLYTGEYAYRHEDGTTVLPLDTLWTVSPPGG
jgi:predicted AAA+ superfamily ATPase